MILESQQQPKESKAGRIILFRPGSRGTTRPSFLLGERQFCSSSSSRSTINPVNDVNRSRTNQTHFTVRAQRSPAEERLLQFSSVLSRLCSTVSRECCWRCVCVVGRSGVRCRSWLANPSSARIYVWEEILEEDGESEQRAICANRVHMSGGLADPLEHIL